MSVREIIESVGVIFTMTMSVYAVIRSSKVQQNKDSKEAGDKQTNALIDIRNKLTEHILDDAKIQSELKANVLNLQHSLENKLDKILEKLDE